MKRRFKRTVTYDEKVLVFEFEYWPPYYSYEEPSEPAEINLLSITDCKNNSLPIPYCETEEFQKISDLLLNLIAEEDALAQYVADQSNMDID